MINQNNTSQSPRRDGPILTVVPVGDTLRRPGEAERPGKTRRRDASLQACNRKGELVAFLHTGESAGGEVDAPAIPGQSLAGKLVSIIRNVGRQWARERRIREEIAYYSHLPDWTLRDIGLERGQIEFFVRRAERRVTPETQNQFKDMIS